MTKWKKHRCRDCKQTFRSGRDAYRHEVWTGHKTEELSVPPKPVCVKEAKLRDFMEVEE